MNVLIVVDVQYDFCPGGALPVKEGDEIIPLINRLRGFFDRVVFTQDWHLKEHISFASNHQKKVGEVIQIKGMIQVLWPDHYVQNSRGARFRIFVFYLTHKALYSYRTLSITFYQS